MQHMRIQNALNFFYAKILIHQVDYCTRTHIEGFLSRLFSHLPLKTGWSTEMSCHSCLRIPYGKMCAHCPLLYLDSHWLTHYTDISSIFRSSLVFRRLRVPFRHSTVILKNKKNKTSANSRNVEYIKYTDNGQ